MPPGQRPPRVAHCVVGGARTFPAEQAWRSLRRNLIEAFGGVGLDSAAPDVYFHMKLVDDAPKSQREWRFDSVDRARDVQSVCAAALTSDLGGKLFARSEVLRPVYLHPHILIVHMHKFNDCYF